MSQQCRHCSGASIQWTRGMKPDWKRRHSWRLCYAKSATQMKEWTKANRAEFSKRATNRSETFVWNKQLQARKHNRSSCKNLLLINYLVIQMSPAGQTWTFTSTRCQLSHIPVIILALCSAFQRLSGSCFVFRRLHLPLGLWTSLPSPSGHSKLQQNTCGPRRPTNSLSLESVWPHPKAGKPAQCPESSESGASLVPHRVDDEWNLIPCC